MSPPPKKNTDSKCILGTKLAHYRSLSLGQKYNFYLVQFRNSRRYFEEITAIFCHSFPPLDTLLPRDTSHSTTYSGEFAAGDERERLNILSVALWFLGGSKTAVSDERFIESFCYQSAAKEILNVLVACSATFDTTLFNNPHQILKL